MNDAENITIRLTRESVCMGDDIEAPHEYIFKVFPDESLKSVIEKVLSSKYFADVEERTWIAVSGKSLAAVTPQSDYIEFFVPPDSLITTCGIENNKLQIHFKQKEEKPIKLPFVVKIMRSFCDFILWNETRKF